MPSLKLKMNFNCFYLTPEDEKITIKNSIKKSIIASDQVQKVEFNLPEEIIPTKIFLKFGESDHQKIKVNSVLMRYNENEINIPDSLFYLFFYYK